MKFEYDTHKNSSNFEKHGIDFEKAQQIWDDPYAFEIQSHVCEDEERFLVIGQIKNKVYTAVITYRNECIRIISVRRARNKEEKLYESIRIRQKD
jgi:uncharacterized DUF497 family protein